MAPASVDPVFKIWPNAKMFGMGRKHWDEQHMASMKKGW